MTANLTYDSFGATNSTATRYTFTGREQDPDLGLIYYRARWYDPNQGRFMSEDPIGLNGGINFYAYVDNSPLNYRDPFGLQKKPQKSTAISTTCARRTTVKNWKTIY